MIEEMDDMLEIQIAKHKNDVLWKGYWFGPEIIMRIEAHAPGSI